MAVNTKMPLTNTADGYLCEGTDIRGGYFTIDAIANISSKITQPGSLCYCTGDSKFYQFNGTWQPVKLEELKAHLENHAPSDAQKNVQADWNATSGDAFIKNKPKCATADKDGFMSKTDKENLDLIVNSFNSEDADSTVNTVKEVLKAFENAPEETNIVNALAGKSNVGHIHEVSTENAAPSEHTHNVIVSGTTEATSSAAVTAVTGVTGDGTATALTGVKVSSSLSAAPGEHKHSYDKTTGITLTANGATADGRITYVQSISGGSGSLTSNATTTGIKYVESISSTGASASGFAKAGSETHTHSYDKTTGVTLSANSATATGRIKYVESISGSTPSLTGTKTFVTGVTAGSGNLISNNTVSGGIKYIESCGTFSQGTLPSLTVTSKSPSKITAWSAGTVPSLTITSKSLSKISAWSAGSKPSLTYLTETVGSASDWSAGTMFSASVSGTVLTLTAGTEPSLTITEKSPSKITVWDAGSTPSLTYTAESVGSASDWDAGSIPSLTYAVETVGSASDWAAGTLPTMGSCTTKYLHHTHISASSSGTGTVGIKDGSYSAATKYLSAAPSNEPTASGTPSATTSFVTGVSGGTTTAATKYLHHTHNGASATTKYLSATPSHTSTESGTNSGTNFNAATAVAPDGTATVLTSVKASGTASVTSSKHTHTYRSETPLTTTGSNETAVVAVTEVKASTN